MKLNKIFEQSDEYEKFLSNGLSYDSVGLSKDSVGLNHYNSFNLDLYLNLYKEHFLLWDLNFSTKKDYTEYQ